MLNRINDWRKEKLIEYLLKENFLDGSLDYLLKDPNLHITQGLVKLLVSRDRGKGKEVIKVLRILTPGSSDKIKRGTVNVTFEVRKFIFENFSSIRLIFSDGRENIYDEPDRLPI